MFFHMKNNSKLKTVDLSWNGLSSEGALAVADCLKQNHVILNIDITANRITEEGAMMLCLGLEANESLKVFKVKKQCGDRDAQDALLMAIPLPWTTRTPQ